MTAIAQAKIWVRLVATLILGGTALSIYSFVASFGTATLVPQVVRLALTVLVCVYLVQGRQWARWLTVILCAVATVTAFSTGRQPELDPSWVTLLRILGAIYLGCIVVLLVPPSVRAYFAGSGGGEAGGR